MHRLSSSLQRRNIFLGKTNAANIRRLWLWYLTKEQKAKQQKKNKQKPTKKKGKNKTENQKTNMI
jgi:hypothetical protein